MRHLGHFLTVTGLVLGSILPARTASAQARQGTPSPTAPAAPTATSSTSITPPRSNNTGQPLQRSWYLSGRVLMDDGSAPPDSVTIRRNCGGASDKPVAYTDSKGRFSVQFGQPQALIPDASVGSEPGGGRVDGSVRSGSPFDSFGNGRLDGCELLAALPGYRSDVVELGARSYMDNPDVGSIVLHRLAKVAGNSISATSYEAPPEARKAYDKGLDAERKQKWPEAQAQFQKATGAYSKYAAAWFELGTVYQHQDSKEQSREAFRKSLEADRRFLKPYLPLASMAFEERDWAQTADLTQTLAQLDEVDYPQAFLLNAIANSKLGKPDAAEKSAREALRLDPKHQLPRVEYVLGMILAGRQDYDGALQMLRGYIQRAPNAPDIAEIKKQIGQIETLAAARAAETPGAAPPPPDRPTP